MSLSLVMGTKPVGLVVKTYDGFGSTETIVYLGDYEISLIDFLVMATYVLTNTDLRPDDPRLQFVKCVKSMKEVDGYNPMILYGKRLESDIPPIPSNERQKQE